MHRNNRIFKLVVAALLCAVGILVPMISPIKINIEPASFTLASHVAIFVAMFLSPKITLAVSVGTALGFQLAGFPPVVVARAGVHIVFAMLGAYWLAKHPDTLKKAGENLLFGLAVSTVHGVSEILAVLPFYLAGSLSAANYSKGFMVSVVLLVGLGTVVHSMVDYYIAQLVYKPVSRMREIEGISAVGRL